jgi:hypothetical protein
LVDADNVAPSRLLPVLEALSNAAVTMQLTASGRRSALDRVDWPADSELLVHSGWQRADAALAAAYSPSADPLVLISGDGDFALLAARHPGPVLVISGAASMRLRERATVVDPALEGTEPILAWLRAHA